MKVGMWKEVLRQVKAKWNFRKESIKTIQQLKILLTKI